MRKADFRWRQMLEEDLLGEVVENPPGEMARTPGLEEVLSHSVYHEPVVQTKL